MKKRIFETKEETSAALAREIFRTIDGSAGPVNIAVSGGSTPAVLFSVLAEEYSTRIDWEKVRFFWVDERSVPPEDDQSNYKMTERTLLNHIDIPDSNIFRVHGEDDARSEALRYSQIIRENVPFEGEIPSFDLVLLGLGDDGHTASIFPGQMELFCSGNICERAVHPQSGQERVTLTGPVINNGKSICFLVCGKSKADIIVRIIDKDPLYPASFVANQNDDVTFFMDSDAAENL